MNQKLECLLQPGQIGTMKLKNRIVFNPLESLFATVNGEVTQRLIDYYVRRAEGGTGLLVVHSAQACTQLDPIDPFPHSLRVDDNAYIPMLSELTEAVHRAGAKIAILVSAGGGVQAMGFPYDRGLEGVRQMTNVGAGTVQSLVSQRPVRKLSVHEIKKIIEVYGLGARRVMLSGFDAFYIHALGGYLISQFISPHFNNRTDEYGGDFDRRLRFLLEIVDSCRKNVGPDFPLVVRMSIDECFPGGRGVEDSVKIAQKLEAAGVNAIDAGAGIYESMHMIIPPIYLPKGVLVDFAAAVKAAVKIPLIAQGRVYDPEMAAAVISSQKADFIGIARGLLSDPDWVNKIQAGRENEIRRCTTCNACANRVLGNLTVRCAINPTAGRESEFREIPPPAAEKKKVAIVGAGPGGMECARIAAERGHSVHLYEKSGELGGGQFKLACSAPYKDEFKNLILYYQSQFAKLKNLRVSLNTTATLDLLEKENPDVVVLATGAQALVPAIEGVDRPNVVTNHDLYTTEKLKGKIVIAGGGCAGSGAADRLSELGLDVTIVEMQGACALDEELITRLTLMHRFSEKKNVTIKTEHTVKRITAAGVLTVNKDNQEELIPADCVVLAFGAVPYNPLEESVKKKFKTYHVIGDARQPKKILDAVADGFMLGNRI
jgi:2,4-dienoyl-CoA reductase-like NADH-dependent reductase (Old Yellow Enzyme family)/thioredoxin reductase